MNTLPLVSIGIPTYNRPEGLERAVRSALAQDYPNLEIIVSDNASTDGTSDVARQLAAQDSRIRYHRHEVNQGPTPNFRFVRDRACGEFYMWLADDDWLEPDIVSACVEFLLNNPEYSMASGDIVYWKEESEVYREFDFSFEFDDPRKRILRYFRLLFVGGLFHSLCRADLAKKIPIHNAIASDWFFVSNMLFLGKNKNLRRDGYHKACEGLSVCHENYARVIGASNFAAHNPYLNTAARIFGDILWQAEVYSPLSRFQRFTLAAGCSWLILRNFYVKRLVKEPLSFSFQTIRSLLLGLKPRRS